MYTVVLMAALTTSPAVPDFGHRRRCSGCCGGYSGCCGGGYGGCCGGGYGGCHGGGYGGGCYGGGCYGGGGYGCCGGASYGAWGGSPYAAMPYEGGGYYAGGTYTVPYYGSPYGGAYYQGAPAGGAYYQGGANVPQGEQVPAGNMPPRPGNTTPGTNTRPTPNQGNRTGGTEEESTPTQVQGPAPALIVVTLPANAVLQFDGVLTRANSTTRVFTSPPLERGHRYYYTMTAQVTRDGRPDTVTQRVYVQAGQTSRVALNFPATETTVRR